MIKDKGTDIERKQRRRDYFYRICVDGNKKLSKAE
jgi:hypothetical protein